MKRSATLALLVLLWALGVPGAMAAVYAITLPDGGDCGAIGGSWDGATCAVTDVTLGADDSLLVLSGTLRLAGTLLNDGGLFVVDDQLLANPGAIVDNRGETSIQGVVAGKGTLINSGIFDNQGDVKFSNVQNSGSLTTSGPFRSATLTNAGGLQIDGTILTVTQVDNGATGSIDGEGTLVATGQAQNDGTILTRQVFSFSSVTNAATISVDELVHAGELFENQGTLTVANWLELQQSGTFSNHGSLVADPDALVQSGQTPDGSFANVGQMIHRGTFVGHLTNEGDLQIDGGTMQGELVNHGSIDNGGTIESVLENGPSGVVTNDGSIDTTTGSNDGMLINNGVFVCGPGGWLQSAEPGQFINRGLVELTSIVGGVVVNECGGTFASPTVILDAVVFAECGCPLGAPFISGEVFDTVDLDLTADGLTWCEVPGRTSDVLYGDLEALGLSGGDFGSSTTACLANDLDGGTLTGIADPPPGEGLWFLVRAAGETWNTGLQQQDRDMEIETSGVGCP